MKQGHVRANGIRIGYQDWGGDGPPCLLLHGIFGNAATWAATAQALQDAGYRAVALDMRGHGHSHRPREGYDRETLVHDVAQAIARLDLPPVVIIGHSIGGLNGWCLAARHPERVAALVVVDMPPELPLTSSGPHMKWAESIPLPFTTRAAAQRFFRQSFAAHPATVDFFLQCIRERKGGYGLMFSRTAARRCFEGIAQRAWWPELKAVRCPTLLVRGSQGAVPLPVAKAMAASLARGELATLASAGHCAHWDQPDAWRTVLLRFLSRHAPVAQRAPVGERVGTTP